MWGLFIGRFAHPNPIAEERMDKYNISIEYCASWNYLPRAASLADELLSNYQHVINDLTLIPSRGGAYEIIVNAHLIYSKKTTKRHANAGEVLNLFQGIVGPNVMIYGTWCRLGLPSLSISKAAQAWRFICQ